MSRQEIVLNVNGVDYELKVDVIATLVDVLRDELGLTGTKIMCNEGVCGACTVLLDETPTLSCMMPAINGEGKKIETIEGLANPNTGDLHPIQEAFVERSGMQCGVCTPGMILTAKAFLEENPDPTEDDVRQALSGNLCRCGNYNRITECVLMSAENIESRSS
jgi:carbon-monoxide dehydrogenase small subunit